MRLFIRLPRGLPVEIKALFTIGIAPVPVAAMRTYRHRAAVNAAQLALGLELYQVAAHGRLRRIQLTAKRLQIDELLRFQ